MFARSQKAHQATRVKGMQINIKGRVTIAQYPPPCTAPIIPSASSVLSMSTSVTVDWRIRPGRWSAYSLAQPASGVDRSNDVFESKSTTGMESTTLGLGSCFKAMLHVPPALSPTGSRPSLAAEGFRRGRPDLHRINSLEYDNENTGGTCLFKGPQAKERLRLGR
ncbi:hypothetical protein C8R44DRAFT_864072 [Mycena epipterygia]|nr:hypothetical protein C8R44DRAFT_864072 [Mycena epipterygia]